jgi:transposase InsO family protein
MPSLGGSRYILVFTNDYSRKSWIFFLKGKDKTFLKFREFKACNKKETGNKIQTLRTDRGGEYLSNDFRDFCRQYGIAWELPQALTPQQNGVSERRN